MLEKGETLGKNGKLRLGSENYPAIQDFTPGASGTLDFKLHFPKLPQKGYI